MLIDILFCLVAFHATVFFSWLIIGLENRKTEANSLSVVNQITPMCMTDCLAIPLMELCVLVHDVYAYKNYNMTRVQIRDGTFW